MLPNSFVHVWRKSPLASPVMVKHLVSLEWLEDLPAILEM